jgi:hypothetical protein
MIDINHGIVVQKRTRIVVSTLSIRSHFFYQKYRVQSVSIENWQRMSCNPTRLVERTVTSSQIHYMLLWCGGGGTSLYDETPNMLIELSWSCKGAMKPKRTVTISSAERYVRPTCEDALV